MLVSIAGEACGEVALAYLPRRDQAPSEWLLRAEELTAVDAWGAVALRSAIEFCARYQSRQVTLSPPRRADVWRLLYHVLGTDCPKHARLSDDAERPNGSAPTAILLPAVRIPNLERADEISSALIETATGPLARTIRFLASQVPELALNALTHGAGAPTDPIACMFYDREEEHVQLVLGDLGSRYERDPTADEALLADLRAQPDGALASAVQAAASRHIDATLTLAAGNGRVYWRSGRWSSAQAVATAGFVVALSVQIS